MQITSQVPNVTVNEGGSNQITMNGREPDHLEVLEMIVQGLYGSPLTLPSRLNDWPQVRPAIVKAIQDIREYRKLKSE